jgi:hypothetical protein
MDSTAEAERAAAEAGRGQANVPSPPARDAGGLSAHSCPVPGYVHLLDLEVFWQCSDCGEIWRVVAAPKSSGLPPEFIWVRDPIMGAGPRKT